MGDEVLDDLALVSKRAEMRWMSVGDATITLQARTVAQLCRVANAAAIYVDGWSPDALANLIKELRALNQDDQVGS